MPVLAVDQSHIKFFEEQGYVVIEDILDPEEDLQPVIEEYEAVLDNLVRRLYAEGKVTSLYRELPFGQRLTRIVAETGRFYSQYFDISLPQSGVTEDTPIHLGKAVFNLLRNPKLLDVVEAFIGPEIYSNPVQHVRIKPPEWALPKGQWDGLSSAVYWHQDNGVILPEADESNILTVWLAISDATEENGCLAVAPESHKLGLLPHCPSPDKGVHIPEKLLPERFIPVPVKRGGALFMTRKTVHVSLRNLSDDIRWSFDLRYNPIGQPTGRPAFPGFIARSKAHPESALTDPEVWAQLWRDARTRIARGTNPVYNRWSADSPVCA
jgi:ectoine hydroxylase-related dioxygenase (phytanoyl-CoA dioxygenase family)